ncbi:MAG: SHOCT domain-containing protein [Candidatus Saccharimonadales bacterium]
MGPMMVARRRGRRRGLIVGAAVGAAAARSNSPAPQEQPVPQATAPVAQAADPYAELEKLGKLKEQGILTQEEFDAKKKQILGI